jgi:hypothetical protein
MSAVVFLLVIEEPASTKSIGVYKSEKDAKAGALEYVEKNTDIKFKANKSKSEESRKVLFTSDYAVITANKVDSYLIKDKSDKKINKRPLSAFMVYSKENRARIVKENPQASFGDVARILGEEWKAAKVSKDQKTPEEPEEPTEPIEPEEEPKASKEPKKAKQGKAK